MHIYIPLRHMRPIHLDTHSAVLIQSIEVNPYPHSDMEYITQIYPGDIGKTVTVSGGTTTWVDLGIHLVKIIRDLVTGAEAASSTRFIKPMIVLEHTSGPFCNVYISQVVYSISRGLLSDFRLTPSMNVDPGTLGWDILSNHETTKLVSWNVGDNNITIDTIVSLPATTTIYPALFLWIDISYMPVAYRTEATCDIAFSNIELGVRCNEYGAAISPTEVARYGFYDAYPDTKSMTIMEQTVTSKHLILGVILVPLCSYEDILPNNVATDAAKFLLRIEMKSDTSLFWEGLGKPSITSISVSPRAWNVPKQNFPFDFVWNSDIFNFIL